MPKILVLNSSKICIKKFPSYKISEHLKCYNVFVKGEIIDIMTGGEKI